MNWKRKVLIPTVKAFGLTTIVFAVLLALCAGMAAHAIWVHDDHHPMFGDQWENFGFAIIFYSAILCIQCGIVLLGNLISAILTGKAFTLITVIVGVSFAVANGTMHIASEDPINAWFLYVFPGTCAALTAILTMIKKWRHPIGWPVTDP